MRHDDKLYNQVISNTMILTLYEIPPHKNAHDTHSWVTPLSTSFKPIFRSHQKLVYNA